MPLGTHRASRAGGSAAALDPARPMPGAEAKNETSPLPSTGYARIFLMTRAGYWAVSRSPSP